MQIRQTFKTVMMMILIKHSFFLKWLKQFPLLQQVVMHVVWFGLVGGWQKVNDKYKVFRVFPQHAREKCVVICLPY